MNRREEAFYEGLVKNEEETEKWQKYESEHKQASENLMNFSKKLNVHVMIPIGTKALLPGKLKHTNETFVSHYGKLFSKCSAYQAGEICKYRIKMAKEWLEKLQQEREMFENKLEKPYEKGVLAGSNEREIIEEYDEEKENLWREEHKKKVKHQKLKEKEERNIKNKKSDKDIFDILEDLEIMDELEAELEGINVEDDDIIQKLMSGKIQVNERKRISHYNNIVIGDKEKAENSIYTNSNEFPLLDSLYKKYKVPKAPDEEVDFTNNNIIPNSELEMANSNGSSNDLPDEVLEIEEHMINLSHHKKIKYLTQMIKIYEKSVPDMKVEKGNDYHQHFHDKLNQLEILDYLYDHLQFLEDKNLIDNSSSNNGNKKKKISFAAHDQIQIINKDDKVSDMLKSNTKQNLKRDIIRLDEAFSNVMEKKINVEKNEAIVDKKKLILDRVENNMKYLNGKLLEQTPPKTLKIKFKHSSQIPPPSNEMNEIRNDNVVNSPSDVYKLFGECSVQNVDNESKLSQTKIDRNEHAYEDVKKKFSNPSLNASNNTQKPILKNKEENSVISLQKPKKSKAKKLDDPILTTAFDKVMGDIVEKPLTEPEALPKERFIDSHAPRKRISRFKQIRNESLSLKTAVDSS